MPEVAQTRPTFERSSIEPSADPAHPRPRLSPLGSLIASSLRETATLRRPVQVAARALVPLSSRPAVADVRRQGRVEDLGGLEIELGDAGEYPLAGPE